MLRTDEDDNVHRAVSVGKGTAANLEALRVPVGRGS
jgi:hypothetical protein